MREHHLQTANPRFRCWLVRPCLGVALLCLLASSASAQSDASLDELNKHWNAAQQAMDAEDWRQAIESLQRVTEILPYEFSSRQLQARSLAKLGQTDAALAALSTAIELGWEDEAALRAEEDLAPLRQDPRFEKLLQRCRALREEKFVLVRPQAEDQPRSDTTRSDTSRSSEPQARPVVLFFHGRGESPRGMAREWQALADELDLCVVLPKGTSRRGQVYLWDAEDAQGNEPYKIDQPAAAEIATAALDWLEREHGIVPRPLVLGGFSQGAVVAAQLASTADNPQSPLAPRALLLFGGAFAKNAQLTMPKDLRIAQFVGTGDRWLPGNQAVRDALARQQVEHRYQELDAGHDLPRPFAETLAPVWREFVIADLK